MASNPANKVDTGAVLDAKPPGFSPCLYFINMLIRLLQSQGRGPRQPFPSHTLPAALPGAKAPWPHAPSQPRE